MSRPGGRFVIGENGNRSGPGSVTGGVVIGPAPPINKKDKYILNF